MGLDIISSDNEKHFHIGYVGFHNLRSCFLLHYGEDLYHDYKNLIFSIEDDEFYERIGDLEILIDHSDCDGELSSNECKLLKEFLIVDEKSVKLHNENNSDRIIELMYEFIDLIEYCADNDDVTLLFG